MLKPPKTPATDENAAAAGDASFSRIRRNISWFGEDEDEGSISKDYSC
jgi:hypothetical protein